jgi:formate dehydrogenase maturation protein FdhE
MKESAKWPRAVQALISEPTAALAAAEANVSERTLQRWRREPAFQVLLAAARAGLVEGAAHRLLKLLPDATSALARGMRSQNEATQLKAAVAVLDRALKAAEQLDLARELEALKEQVARIEGRLGTCPACGQAAVMLLVERIVVSTREEARAALGRMAAD